MIHKRKKIIKRYQNRKLYDTQDSCYVTLEEIRDMIKEDYDIQVIDNKSKDDLTSVTLAQIILEEERKNQKLLPISALKSIIASGGETFKDLVQKSIETGVKEIGAVKSYVDRKIKSTVETVESIPTVAHEIKDLKVKIDHLEKKLKIQEKKKK